MHSEEIREENIGVQIRACARVCTVLCVDIVDNYEIKYL